MPSKSRKVTISSCWSDPEGLEFDVEYSYFEQMTLDGEEVKPSYKELRSFEIYYKTHPLEDVMEEVLPELGMSLETLRQVVWGVIEEEF